MPNIKTHNEIDQRHAVPMKTALLKNRSIVDEPRMNFLYRAAEAAFGDDKMQAPQGISISRNLTRNEAGVKCILTVSCTDEETGMFVQLTGDTARGINGALLTFGQRFCQENWDKMRQQRTVRIW